jgi:hypothetical protein
MFATMVSKVDLATICNALQARGPKGVLCVGYFFRLFQRYNRGVSTSIVFNINDDHSCENLEREPPPPPASSFPPVEPLLIVLTSAAATQICVPARGEELDVILKVASNSD